MFPDNYIDIEGTNLISTFEKKSLKKVTLKTTTTRQCSTSKTVSSNSYLISLSIHNETSSDNFIKNRYEVYVPSIYSGWEDYARKDREEYLNIQQNRSTN